MHAKKVILSAVVLLSTLSINGANPFDEAFPCVLIEKREMTHEQWFWQAVRETFVYPVWERWDAERASEQAQQDDQVQKSCPWYTLN